MSIVKTFLAWFHEDCANPMEEYFNHLEARIEAIEEKLGIVPVGNVAPVPASVDPIPSGDADSKDAGEVSAGTTGESTES